LIVGHLIATALIILYLGVSGFGRYTPYKMLIITLLISMAAGADARKKFAGNCTDAEHIRSCRVGRFDNCTITNLNAEGKWLATATAASYCGCKYDDSLVGWKRMKSVLIPTGTNVPGQNFKPPLLIFKSQHLSSLFWHFSSLFFFGCAISGKYPGSMRNCALKIRKRISPSPYQPLLPTSSNVINVPEAPKGNKLQMCLAITQLCTSFLTLLYYGFYLLLLLSMLHTINSLTKSSLLSNI